MRKEETSAYPHHKAHDRNFVLRSIFHFPLLIFAPSAPFRGQAFFYFPLFSFSAF